MTSLVRLSRLVAPVTALAVVASGLVKDKLPTRPSNVVVISLDTTRADRLPAYGFSGMTTPALDRIARQGMVFDCAETVAPLTLPAHTSLFTGLYPPHHGVRDNADAPAVGVAAAPTLAEILRARGFRTAAFVGSVVLSRSRGLARGFDTYSDGAYDGLPPPRRRDGSIVIDEASAWIDRQDGAPFFLWVHLYDVHGPQRLPIEYRRAYGDSYEGGLAYADAQVGRLLNSLERKGVIPSTAVIVAGDHGESLGDHGEREHGIFVYESTMHVPLIVRSPGARRGHADGLVSLVDVLPTVVDLFGLPRPSGLDGVSLVPALRGRRLPEREVYAESMYPSHLGWGPLRMLRRERMKYIEAPRPELYDLATDPFERRNLVSERPAAADGMRARLAAIAAISPRYAAAGAPDVETARGLAALGYISGRPAPPAPVLDAKDYIRSFSLRRHPESGR